MEFCTRCGTLLTPRETEGKKVLHCPSCGTSKEIGASSRRGYVLSSATPSNDNVVVVKEEVVPYAKTKANCRRCGNAEAYYYSVQTRGGDEAETVYLTCTKCKHVWKMTS